MNDSKYYFIVSGAYKALTAVIIFLIMGACEVDSFHLERLQISSVSRLSRLYVQTPPDKRRKQQKRQPFIETIKDSFFPTIGINDDIEDKTEEDYQREALEKVDSVISISIIICAPLF